jgi:hypothetical protein
LRVDHWKLSIVGLRGDYLENRIVHLTLMQPARTQLTYITVR